MATTKSPCIDCDVKDKNGKPCYHKGNPNMLLCTKRPLAHIVKEEPKKEAAEAKPAPAAKAEEKPAPAKK